MLLSGSLIGEIVKMTMFTVETFRWCQSNEQFETTVVGSTGVKYPVTYSSTFGWHCACEGFKWRQKCRHIAMAEESRCKRGWEAAAGSPLNDWPKNECPDCGAPAVPVKVAV